MSKLFKQLIYDTDWISQPGDPITSPNGNTSVSANNDGTATITKPGTPVEKQNCVIISVNDGRGWSYWFRFRNTMAELEDYDFVGPITLECANANTYNYPVPESAWKECTAERAIDADSEWRFSCSDDSDVDGIGLDFFNSSSHLPNTAVDVILYVAGHVDENGFAYNTYTYTTYPTETKTLATQAYVDAQIGDINSVLDAINGEVI